MTPAPQPSLPFYQPSQTRYEAAEAIAPKVTALQAEVLSLIRAAGERGLTAHELVAQSGWLTNTAAPRLTECRALGLIVACGRRAAPGHRAATAWRIA